MSNFRAAHGLSHTEEVSIRLHINKDRRALKYDGQKLDRHIRAMAAETGFCPFNIRWILNMLKLEAAAYEMTSPDKPPAQDDGPSWAENRAAMDGDRHWKK
jgi:hypothetical protein